MHAGAAAAKAKHSWNADSEKDHLHAVHIETLPLLQTAPDTANTPATDDCMVSVIKLALYHPVLQGPEGVLFYSLTSISL